MVTLQLAQIIQCTEAEGPGRRMAVWFQGCPLRCPGCCNPEMLSFSGGQSYPLGDVVKQLEHALQNEAIQGITFLGGEPFAHAAPAAQLAQVARFLGLSVMVFSGYTLEQLQADPAPAVAQLLALTDLLVDGPYQRQHPDNQRRWIGSTNQRIHFLSDRYQASDACWQQRNTLELRLTAAGLSVNGFPSPAAQSFWRRP